MIILWVLGGILALLLLLLLIPVSVRAQYLRGEFSLSIHYLFLRFPITDAMLKSVQDKAGEQAEEKAEEKPPKKEQKKGKKKEGISGLVKSWWAFLRECRPALRILRRHLVVYKLRLYGTISAQDAEKTALQFARISALVTALVVLTGELLTLEKPQIQLLPEFTRDACVWDLSGRIRIQPLFLISAALQGAWAYVHTVGVAPKQRRSKKRKGGRNYESATSHQ